MLRGLDCCSICFSNVVVFSSSFFFRFPKLETYSFLSLSDFYLLLSLKSLDLGMESEGRSDIFAIS